ncbi:hypothetical protein, partial [Dickeya dianthicola]
MITPLQLFTPLQWLGLSLSLYLAGALLSLCLCRRESLAIRLSGLCALAGGCAGALAAAPVLLG